MPMMAKASLPFFLLLLSTAVTIPIFSEISLWLPGKL
jgi:hypothetical protein